VFIAKASRTVFIAKSNRTMFIVKAPGTMFIVKATRTALWLAQDLAVFLVFFSVLFFCCA